MLKREPLAKAAFFYAPVVLKLRGVSLHLCPRPDPGFLSQVGPIGTLPRSSEFETREFLIWPATPGFKLFRTAKMGHNPDVPGAFHSPDSHQKRPSSAAFSRDFEI